MSFPPPDIDSLQIPEMGKLRYDEYVVIEVRAINCNSSVEYRKHRLLKLSCYSEDGVIKYDKDSVANQLAIHKAYVSLFDEATYKSCSASNFKGTYRIITDQATVLDFANPDRGKEIE